MYLYPVLLNAPASPGELRCAPGSSVPSSGRGRVACIRPTSEGAETLGNCARWNAGCTVHDSWSASPFGERPGRQAAPGRRSSSKRTAQSSKEDRPVESICQASDEGEKGGLAQ